MDWHDRMIDQMQHFQNTPVYELDNRPLMGGEKPAPDPTNPKDAIGSMKVPMGLFPAIAIAYGSLGMFEGELKYGLVNYRATPVRASIYLDALHRHIAKWASGEERDKKTKVPHLGNALSCIAIILDARAAGTLIDDRGAAGGGFAKELEGLTPVVEHLRTIFKDADPKHFTIASLKEAA
jgi:hypothetical protein